MSRKRCPACQGKCRLVSKFHIFRKVWLVETIVFPCTTCSSVGVIFYASPQRKGRRGRRSGKRSKVCGICGAKLQRWEVTRHHLRPKALNKHTKGPKVVMCHPCHTHIHKMFSLEDLDSKFNTVEKLRSAILVRP